MTLILQREQRLLAALPSLLPTFIVSSIRYNGAGCRHPLSWTGGLNCIFFVVVRNLSRKALEESAEKLRETNMSLIKA